MTSAGSDIDDQVMRSDAHRVNANGLEHFVRDYGPVGGRAALLMHGFPDSGSLWEKIAPPLGAAGYRVIVPDMRGFGQTDMPQSLEEYELRRGAIPDMVAILDALAISKAHIVGHDFGAAVAWALAAERPDRCLTLAALSVGHPRAFLAAGAAQKWRSLYIVFHQFRGLCEAAYRANDWAILRRHWSGHGDIEEAIALLDRPGRLTAGLNWYRSNISFARMFRPPAPGAMGPERVSIPALGVWSDGDPYLTERQMELSGDFVDGLWRYERIMGVGHWIPLDAPDRLAALLIGHWQNSGNVLEA